MHCGGYFHFVWRAVCRLKRLDVVVAKRYASTPQLCKATSSSNITSQNKTVMNRCLMAYIKVIH